MGQMSKSGIEAECRIEIRVLRFEPIEMDILRGQQMQ